MSFGDFLIGLGKTIFNNFRVSVERQAAYAREYNDLSDEELFRIGKRGNNDQKLACIRLLKERGYGKSDDFDE